MNVTLKYIALIFMMVSVGLSVAGASETDKDKPCNIRSDFARINAQFNATISEIEMRSGGNSGVVKPAVKANHGDADSENAETLATSSDVKLNGSDISSSLLNYFTYRIEFLAKSYAYSFAQESLFAKMCYGSRNTYLPKTCSLFSDTTEEGLPVQFNSQFRSALESDLRDAPYCWAHNRANAFGESEKLSTLVVLADRLANHESKLDVAGVWNNFEAARTMMKCDDKSTDHACRMVSAVAKLIKQDSTTVSREYQLFKLVTDSVSALKERQRVLYVAMTAAQSAEKDKRDGALEALNAAYADVIDANSDLFGSLRAIINAEDTKQSLDKVESLFRVHYAVLAKDYSAAIDEISRDISCDANESKLCNAITIATRISGIKSQNEFNDFLDQYASPLNAWKLKQQDAYSNHSLTSQVGAVSAGLRFEVDGVEVDDHQWLARANIGFDWRIRQYVGVQVQLLDLAPAMLSRTYDTASGTLTPVKSDKLNSYWAPGLSVYYSIHDTPVIVGFSYADFSNGYELIDAAGNAKSIDMKVKGFFVAMDLTLFGF